MRGSPPANRIGTDAALLTEPLGDAYPASMQTKPRRRWNIQLFWSSTILVLVVVGVLATTAALVRRTLLASLDERLSSAASSLKYLLAEDFHDRALDPSSIPLDEELRNRARFNDYCASTGFAWVYTLVEYGGKLYFTAPTVTDAEAEERPSWYFYPYDDAPEAFFDAIATGKPAFFEYHDQWGAFRTVALPQKSPGGRPYLACVDMGLSTLRGISDRILLFAFLAAMVVLGGCVPLLIFHINASRKRTDTLVKLNQQLHAAAHRAGELSSTIFAHSADAVLILDPSDGVLYANPAFTALFGWSPSTLGGPDCPFIPPELRVEFAAKLSSMKGSRLGFRDWESKRLGVDGTAFDVSISAAPLSGDDGNYEGCLLIFRDLTRRKKLEERAAQDEKLRALATLSAGAAHDFNNVLMVIQGNLSLLDLHCSDDDEIKGLLAGIGSAVKSATALTRQLLSFARGNAAVAESVDMGRLSRSCGELYGAGREGLSVEFSEVGRGPFMALADPERVEQAILNIVVNAEKAMEGPGVVSMELSMRELDAATAEELSLHVGPYVALSITDHGVGMDDAVRRRVFEPFFTTRPRGQGSGLGLASAQAAVRAAGGVISVESRVGVGSTFTIYLPSAFAFTGPGERASMGESPHQ